MAVFSAASAEAREFLNYSKKDLTHHQLHLYGARYSESPSSGPATSGFSGGFNGYFVFSPSFMVSTAKGERYIEEPADREFSYGWVFEAAAGAGSYDSDLSFDLFADIFGIMGRYKINGSNQIGISYDPIVIDANPVQGYLGSKLVLKYLFREFEVNLSRGNQGFFYGCFVAGEEAGDESPMYTASLQYLFASNDPRKTQFTIGAKYMQQEREEGGRTDTHPARGIHLFLGYLL